MKNTTTKNTLPPLSTHTADLLPLYDGRKSFYNKAQVKTITTADGLTAYLLYSYKTPVALASDCWLYLNGATPESLLYSQTTLRHIKEFYKQFLKPVDLTKKELQQKAIIKAFDFLTLHETNNRKNLEIWSNQEYTTATHPDQTKFFKNAFKGHKERKQTYSNGASLLTSFNGCFSNRYFYDVSKL